MVLLNRATSQTARSSRADRNILHCGPTSRGHCNKAMRQDNVQSADRTQLILPAAAESYRSMWAAGWKRATMGVVSQSEARPLPDGRCPGGESRSLSGRSMMRRVAILPVALLVARRSFLAGPRGRRAAGRRPLPRTRPADSRELLLRLPRLRGRAKAAARSTNSPPTRRCWATSSCGGRCSKTCGPA